MPVSKLRHVLETGVQNKASDWHIREGSTVVLRVDSQNPTGATGLYAKAGMREEDRNFEFQLTLRPARA